jgi:hypothetical protein
MNIDERLEKLTERHEALAQSLELMQHMQQENETRWEERWVKIDARFDKIADGMEKLLSIAQSHEHRIQGLERK